MNGLACAYWSQDSSLKALPAPRQAKLFEYTHAALNRDLDFPKPSTLQACQLVLHEQPDESSTTESPRIWVCACQATACAAKFRTLSRSHSVDIADMGDLASDEDAAGLPSENLLEEHNRKSDGDSSLRFLEVIKLTKILGKVLEDG